MESKYGIAIRCDVTPAIDASIKRLSPKRGPKTQSDVIREALHYYCLQADPAYKQEMLTAEDE
jgi:hypothetical protein